MVLGAAIAVILLSANAHCVGSSEASPLAATPPSGRRLPTLIASVDWGWKKISHLAFSSTATDAKWCFAIAIALLADERSFGKIP